MDPFKLLSRSTKISKQRRICDTKVPSRGEESTSETVRPANTDGTSPSVTRKRKRGYDAIDDTQLDFFGAGHKKGRSVLEDQTIKNKGQTAKHEEEAVILGGNSSSTEDVKAVLKQHKLKVIWLNSQVVQGRKQGRKKRNKENKSDICDKSSVFPDPIRAFRDLRTRFSLVKQLDENLNNDGYSAPTEVQMGALPLLLEDPPQCLIDVSSPQALDDSSAIDLLTVAPTGSGKTLAFLIPLLHRLCHGKRVESSTVRSTSAVILAPTKELAGQITNESRKLAHNTGVKVTQVQKGMRLTDDSQGLQTVVKSDILVSTPGVLAAVIEDGLKSDPDVLPNVLHLVLDEADVLLDPLFREQTLAIWNNLPHRDLRVSLWSATMGSNIEELARSVIKERLERLSQKDGFDMSEAPLLRLVVGLKDSAVPNVQHRLVYAASEQGKLMGLRQLLHPATPLSESGPPLLPPFLVFTQTIERAIALHSELLYDIPAEAGGISRIAVLHSDLSTTARSNIMTRFRKGEIWILITTDLLSRGVDFRGVNGVVNYDIPTSSAAYVHRVGRTGRAGREGGVAVTLYSKEDIPYLKHIANVVAIAQKQKAPQADDGLQRWLLDALPSLSKNAKQQLKKHGVEARSMKGMQKDPRAAKKARISSKAGFVRREEHKRKGAIAGSQRRQAALVNDGGDDTDFDGFD